MISPSTRAGMGAIPFAGGVTFRVWAPFASSVSVSGSFNGWSGAATPLASEGSSGNIPMILQGQEFLEWHYFEVDPDDDSEMDWTLPNAYPGIVILYRDLIRLRRNWS